MLSSLSVPLQSEFVILLEATLAEFVEEANVMHRETKSSVCRFLVPIKRLHVVLGQAASTVLIEEAQCTLTRGIAYVVALCQSLD